MPDIHSKYCQRATCIRGGAIHHFVLIGLFEQYTKFKSKTFKLTFIFAMVTKNGHQNGLKNGKANILEQI